MMVVQPRARGQERAAAAHSAAARIRGVAPSPLTVSFDVAHHGATQ